MLGEIVWEYAIPEELGTHSNTGLDVELLPSDNILFVLPHNGVYEVDRDGNIVWSYADPKISHDADRLGNGNTLIVWGGGDTVEDAQVKEISPDGDIVWAWYAKDESDKPPFDEISNQGWTHMNSAERLPNGNTLLSPRNFQLLVEVGPDGAVVRTIGEGILHNVHDPEVLSDGNILLANHNPPHRAEEIDPNTNAVVWQSMGFQRATWPVRDANRLPNGNTLIVGTTTIVEVTSDRRIVWQLTLTNDTFVRESPPGYGFYKAERISSN